MTDEIVRGLATALENNVVLIAVLGLIYWLLRRDIKALDDRLSDHEEHCTKRSERLHGRDDDFEQRISRLEGKGG